MPINEKLFGLYTSSLSLYTIQALKTLIFIRYGLSDITELRLRSVPHPVVPGVGLIQNSEGERIEDGILVGTVRMGYGHHRMAYSLYTWAVHQKQKAYLHDILAFDIKESHAIKEIDGFYVCLKCGLKIESVIDAGQEWRNYNNDDSRGGDQARCDMPTNELLPKSSMGGLVGWGGR
ncbi:MAG: hypothetical protein EBS19_00545, partial [Spirochaetia bacterium]|nr:hypothetical protein [Spirochaetia bacterium]